MYSKTLLDKKKITIFFCKLESQRRKSEIKSAGTKVKKLKCKKYNYC